MIEPCEQFANEVTACLRRWSEESDMEPIELDEIEFQLECMRRGHTVSIPICDNAGYDAIVDGRNGLSRVQVRGTTILQTSRYQVGTGIGKNKVNTKGDYDYLAVRIPNHDAWYLVPQNELLNSANAKFYPHNSKSKGRYEKYRDAFGQL